MLKSKFAISSVLALALSASSALAGGHTSDNEYEAYGYGEYGTSSGVDAAGQINYTESGAIGGVVTYATAATQHPNATGAAEGEVQYYSVGLAADEDSSSVVGGGGGIVEVGSGVLVNGDVVRDEEAEGESYGNYGGGGDAAGDNTFTVAAGGTVGDADAATKVRLHGGSHDAASARNKSGMISGAMASGEDASSSSAGGYAGSYALASEVEND